LKSKLDADEISDAVVTDLVSGAVVDKAKNYHMVIDSVSVKQKRAN